MKEQDEVWNQRYTAQREEMLQVMRRHDEEKKQAERVRHPQMH